MIYIYSINMKATKFIAAGVIGMIACTMLGACVHSSTGKLASGKRSEKSIDVAMFNKLTVSGGIEVIFTQGPQTPVEISCNEELIDRVIVKQKGKRLKISIDREGGFYFLDEKVRVSLQAEALTDIDASSGSQVKIRNGLALQGPLSVDASSGSIINIQALKGAELKADGSSGAVVNIEGIDARAVEADVSSGAVVTLAGKCNILKVDASSGAVVNTGDLVTQKTDVDSSSGALVHTNARKSRVGGKHGSAKINR